jgi:hypothetical protein
MNIDAPKLESELLAFSTILAGLLASGHFTHSTNPETYDCEQPEPGLKRFNYGEDWKEAAAEWPDVYTRHTPHAFETAVELYKASRQYIIRTTQ